MQNPQPADPNEALEHLGHLSLREPSMDNLLQTVADLTKTVMPGNPEISVSLLVKDHPTTVVSTGDLATYLDETQYERGHGPACTPPHRRGDRDPRHPRRGPVARLHPARRRARPTSAPCPPRWPSTRKRRSPAR